MNAALSYSWLHSLAMDSYIYGGGWDWGIGGAGDWRAILVLFSWVLSSQTQGFFCYVGKILDEPALTRQKKYSNVGIEILIQAIN